MKRYGMILAEAKRGATMRTVREVDDEWGIDSVTEYLAAAALNVTGVEVRSGWAPGLGKARVRAEMQSRRTKVMEWYERSVVTPTGGVYVVALFEIN